MLLQVKELAQLSHVPPDTIRYYTRIGLLRPSRDPDNGYRQFTVSDNKRMDFISKAKRLGYTLNLKTSVKRYLVSIYKHPSMGCL